METCKYGSGAGKRKPTAVKRKGVVCRAYKLTDRKVDEDMKRLKEQTKGRKINLYEEDEPETADIITVNG